MDKKKSPRAGSDNIEKIDEGAFKSYLMSKNIENVLIGRGFCLAHPDKDLQNIFNPKEPKAISKIIDAIWKDKEAFSKSPSIERFLHHLRVKATSEIIKDYARGFYWALFHKELDPKTPFHAWWQQYKEKECKGRRYHALPFLKRFDNIFTVNIDPLLYFEIMLEREEQLYSFCDGFDGDRFIPQAVVTNRLEDKQCARRVYFLHGAWFIQANYKKEGLNQEPIRTMTFRSEINREKGLASPPSRSLNDLFNGEKELLPLAIIEDRAKTKQYLINESVYLRYCQKQLRKVEGNLLVFGMSFNDNEHILKVLNDCRAQQIFVSCYDKVGSLEVNRDFYKKMFEKFDSLREKISYVYIPNELVWSKK